MVLVWPALQFGTKRSSHWAIPSVDWKALSCLCYCRSRTEHAGLAMKLAKGPDPNLAKGPSQENLLWVSDCCNLFSSVLGDSAVVERQARNRIHAMTGSWAPCINPSSKPKQASPWGGVLVLNRSWCSMLSYNCCENHLCHNRDVLQQNWRFDRVGVNAPPIARVVF